MSVFPPQPTTKPTQRKPASYFRDWAKVWREKAAALPDDDLKQTLYLELAESYLRLAASYERRVSHRGRER